jgi:hypothetical protein
MTDFAGHDFIIVLFLRAVTKVERVMGIEPTCHAELDLPRSTHSAA